MSFCHPSGYTIPSFTTVELNAIYPNGVLPSSIPSMTNGLASNGEVDSVINGLKSRKVIPVPPEPKDVNKTMFNTPDTNDPLTTYVKAVNTLLANIKSEYCFYEDRYFNSVDSFLTALTNNASDSDAKLTRTRNLNKKLLFLTQIVNAIAATNISDTARFNTSINAVNDSILNRKNKLLKQNEILERETVTADVNKRMVEYTAEKNKANQNILAIYGVLNLVALAMIFYVART
jgi:hypothetical protein